MILLLYCAGNIGLLTNTRKKQKLKKIEMGAKADCLLIKFFTISVKETKKVLCLSCFSSTEEGTTEQYNCVLSISFSSLEQQVKEFCETNKASGKAVSSWY